MKKLLYFGALFFTTSFAPTYGYAQNSADPSQKQVKFFFPGAKIQQDYKFTFPASFTEVTINANDGVKLSCLLFKADSAKGVILYLHGNTGGNDKWGFMSKTYTNQHFDLFLFDYRGYGRSEGFIKNENEIYGDVQSAYDYLR